MLKKLSAPLLGALLFLIPFSLSACSISSSSSVADESSAVESAIDPSSPEDLPVLPDSSTEPPMLWPTPQTSEQTPTTPEPTPDPEPPKTEKEKLVKVLVDGLNIRSGAGTTYSALGTAEKGEYFPLLETKNGFYKTVYRGKTGYLSTKSAYTTTVEQKSASEKVKKVLLEGYKTLGTPYVYGAVRYHDGTGTKYKGFTVNKFDCSSLMQYIFYQGAGVCLKENTRTQVAQGTAVKKADLAVGDLLFFTNDSRRNNTGSERIGHVALYLGDNKILHTASDYCKIEEISLKRWGYFITARRIL